MLTMRARCVRSLLLSAAFCPVLWSQEMVGSYARGDAAGLQAAVQRSPENVGLQLRLAQALLIETQAESRSAKRMNARLDDVQDLFKKILEKNPNSIIPLRALARDAYYSKRLDEAVTLGRRVLAIEPTEMVVATDVVKALLRLGREAEAVETMLGWFKSGNMPAFGATQGLLTAFVAIPNVKSGLDAGFKKLVAETPHHVHLRLAYSAFLFEVGSLEDAWLQFHEAEQDGLCDASSGGRHPFASTLTKKKPEPDFPGAFAGNDVAELAKQVEANPKHAGIKCRLARRTEMPITARNAGKDRSQVAPYSPADKEQLAKAADLYRAATDLNPMSWQPLARAAELMVEIDKPADAVPLAEKAVKLSSPLFVPGYMTLSRARFKAGDAKAAASDFVNYARDVEPGKSTDAFYTDLCPGADKAPLAPFAAALDEAAKADPKSANLWAHLASLRLLIGDRNGTRDAAIQAERAGLVGLRGWPHRLLMDAFGVKPPEGALDGDAASGR